MRYVAFTKEYDWGKKYLVYDLWTSPIEQREEATKAAHKDLQDGFARVSLEPVGGYKEETLDDFMGPAGLNATVFHWNMVTRTWG
jgi:hypothetical protein